MILPNGLSRLKPLTESAPDNGSSTMSTPEKDYTSDRLSIVTHINTYHFFNSKTVEKSIDLAYYQVQQSVV